MTIEQLLRDGQYPNPSGNTTLAQAVDFQQFLAPFFASTIVVVTSQQTQQAWPVLAEIVAIDGYEIPADAKLNFALKVNDGGRDVYLGVANLQYVRVTTGDRQSAIIALEKIIPDYAGKPELLEKVMELKPFVPPPPVIVVDPTHLPPAPAMPDWFNPTGSGRFAVRPGDDSPFNDTFYTDPNGAKWAKRDTIGFGGLRSDARWEKVN